MTLFTMTQRTMTLALFGLLATPAARAGDETVSVKQLELEKEGTQLIDQLEDVARDIRYNSDRLTSFAHDRQISKWTHFHHLQQIKELVNDGLRPAIRRLVEIREELPSWHQHAIDQMLDSARLLAADTNSAILRKSNADVPPAFDTEYKELIATIHGHAESLVETSDAAGKYASAHRQAVLAGLKVPTKH